MLKIISIFFLSSMTLLALTAKAAIDPSSLVKVTNENNPKCVEFYNYNGELYCSTKPSAVPPVNPNVKNYEKQTIVFDERPWRAAWGKKSDTITTVEYVPGDDDIENWNELITSQFIPGVQDKITPKEYVDNVVKAMKESGFNPIITIIEDTPDQVIFEFRIESPENLKQDELQKVTKGKDGIYLLHYVIKKSDMGGDNRAKWLQNLKQSTITQTKNQ